MAKAKTIWIGGGLSVLAVLAILFSTSGVTVQYTGDITCENECVSFFNITSKSKICFNVTEIIDTNPKVKTELYWMYSGKWKKFNLTKDCIAANYKKQFKIVGYKQKHETIKWGVPQFNIDPVWKGAIISVFDGCRITAVRQSIQDYTSDCSDFTHPNGTISQLCDYIPIYFNETYCVDSPANYLIYDGVYIDTASLGVKCSEVSGTITCDDCFDGNCNGLISDGESYAVQITDDNIDFGGHNSNKIKLKFESVGLG